MPETAKTARGRARASGGRQAARGHAAACRESQGQEGTQTVPQRMREDLGQAEVWISQGAAGGGGAGVGGGEGTPRSAEGWRCLLQGQEHEPFDRHQPFLPWGPHSCGELNCTAGGPSQQKGDPAPQGSPYR